MAFGSIDTPAITIPGRKPGGTRFFPRPVMSPYSGPADSTYWDDPSALGPPGQAVAAGTPNPSGGASTNAGATANPLANLLGGIDFSNPLVLGGIALAAYFLFFKKGR